MLINMGDISTCLTANTRFQRYFAVDIRNLDISNTPRVLAEARAALRGAAPRAALVKGGFQSWVNCLETSMICF